MAQGQVTLAKRCSVTKVLQVFVELEIPHIYHSVARNSPRRQELVDKWDVFQVPYIEVRHKATRLFNMFISAPILYVWNLCLASMCEVLVLHALRYVLSTGYCCCA